MKLLALVPSISDTSPGQRFRMEQWEPLLRDEGIEVSFEPFETPELNRIVYSRGNWFKKARLMKQAFGRRLALVRSLHDFDAVYVFREAAMIGPAIIERRILRARIPMIFDFDDAIFVRYVSPANGILSLLKCAGKTRTNCRIADHVIAGNAYLADYALRFNPNVTIVPTTIDTDKYQPEAKPRTSHTVTIGWTGSHSTVRHLDLLSGVFTELARKEKFRLRVICPEPYLLEGVEVESVRWSASREVDDLKPIDIGVMPLPDDPWSRGKCACKALQYMALGIPTVCSPVGVNSELIRDGQNGFLARTDRQWLEKLTALLRSSELRRRVGLAGMSLVRSNYSARSQAPRVCEILRSVVH